MKNTHYDNHALLFEAPDFIVRYAPAQGKSCCAVSFSSFTDEPRLDRPGFGESFLRSRGYNAIHVINRTNVWYQYPEMQDALRVIRSFTSGFSQAFTYGSSMGGYAAIRFADAIGAKTAIAISPQFSVAPDVVPFDRRWRSIAKHLSFPLELSFSGSTETEPLVFYDSEDLDARHFEMIASAFPMTKGVRLKHAGHPAGGFLSEIGMLGAAITEILERRFEPGIFEAKAHERRGQSSHYLFTLARRQPPWRPRTKQSLAARAAFGREDAAYLVYQGLLVEQTGAMAEAESLLRRANAILPDHPTPLRALGAFLLRNSRHQEALEFTERLFSLNPERDEFERLARLAIWSSGDLRRLPQVSRRRIMASSLWKTCRPWRLADDIIAWLARRGLGGPVLALAQPYVRVRIARHTALRAEIRLIDEWRPTPVRKKLLRRLRIHFFVTVRNRRASR